MQIGDQKKKLKTYTEISKLMYICIAGFYIYTWLSQLSRDVYDLSGSYLEATDTRQRNYLPYESMTVFFLMLIAVSAGRTEKRVQVSRNRNCRPISQTNHEIN